MFSNPFMWMEAPGQPQDKLDGVKPKMCPSGACFNRQLFELARARQPLVNHVAGLRRLNQSP